MHQTTKTFIATVVLVSCQATIVGAQPIPARIRDSAGVRIVEHAAVSTKNFGIRLDDAPFLTLGGLRDDPRLEFSGRHFFLTGARLSDGRVVVLDEQSLKWFDAKGALIGVSGRAGSGPGEFRSTRDLCVLRGDTVMVLEGGSGRVSLWDRNGKFLREFMRPPGFPPFDSCREDGTLVVRGGDENDVSLYRVIRANGAEVYRLGPIATPRYRSPYMTEPYVLPWANGYVVADARRYEYRIIDFTGRIRQIVRSGPPPAKLSESEWLAAAKRLFPFNPDAAARVARGDSLRTKPAFSSMRVDPSSSVWIRDYQEPFGWNIFDARGLHRGRIVLNGPVGLPTRDIVRVASDHAVLRRVGPDGEVYLDFHRITIAK